MINIKGIIVILVHVLLTCFVIGFSGLILIHFIEYSYEQELNLKGFKALGYFLEALEKFVFYMYFITLAILITSIIIGNILHTKFEDNRNYKSSKAISVSSGILLWLFLLVAVFGGGTVISITK